MENLKFTLNKHTTLKAYYMREYPTDELRKDIKAGITFYDLFKCLDQYKCVYDFMGAGDSIVRERMFEALSGIMECDYNYIYYQWLYHPNSKQDLIEFKEWKKENQDILDKFKQN
tara:strand:+ start:92 stop:436 length:345 start_codon:yes stop_codon:yes gene_type:complete